MLILALRTQQVLLVVELRIAGCFDSLEKWQRTFTVLESIRIVKFHLVHLVFEPLLRRHILLLIDHHLPPGFSLLLEQHACVRLLLIQQFLLCTPLHQLFRLLLTPLHVFIALVRVLRETFLILLLLL